MQRVKESKKILLLIVLFPVFILGFIIFSIRYIFSVLFMKDEAWRLAVAFDKLANASLGGDENETISTRANRSKDKFLAACVLCRFLDLFDKGHCEKYGK